MAYGVLYYAFTVLAPRITADTGWSATAVNGAFSVGNIVGALAGIPLGRVLQRFGPRPVMTVGSVLAAAAITTVASAPTYPIFAMGWVLVGVSTACTFYPPAFAALTQWFGTGRVRAITTLTLAAGFASTIFAPLTAAIENEVGWRQAYVSLALLLLVVTVPAHALALRLPWAPGVRHVSSKMQSDRSILLSRTFLMIATSGALTALVMYASLVNLVPLLLERGLNVSLAAWALGAGGVGQVGGRLLYPSLVRRLGPNSRAATVTTCLGLTVLGLAVVPGPVPTIFLLAILCGAARGLGTLVAATAISDRWGVERYATLNGVYNAPLGIAAAAGPGIGAAAAAWTGSQARLYVLLAFIAVLAAVLAAAAGPQKTSG
jgi:MFS family permease